MESQDKQITALAKKFLSCIKQYRSKQGYYFGLNKSSKNYKLWMANLVKNVGGATKEIIADNWTFIILMDTLDLVISNNGDYNKAVNGIKDTVNSLSEELLEWVQSLLDRMYYVNTAVKDGLVDVKNFSLEDALAAGQELERKEIFEAVFAALEN